MSSDTIKIDEDVKEELNELKEGDEITRFGTLSYNDVVNWLLHVARGDEPRIGEDSTSDTRSEANSTDSGGDDGDNVGVNKSSAGSGDSVKDKINAVRMESGTGSATVEAGSSNDEEPEDDEE